ncbi:hypothetical protein DFAR_2850003 [Desulfarculales bacterium]
MYFGMTLLAAAALPWGNRLEPGHPTADLPLLDQATAAPKPGARYCGDMANS